MPIITISRGAKSGGIALANELAKRLGYRCLSREIILESARTYNIEEEVLQAELNEVPSLWQRLTRERARYLIFVRCALLQAAKQDRLIYHGHAGQFFLDGIRHVLKVRIVAPQDQRVRAVIDEQGLDREQALQHIDGVDATRKRWVKLLYDKDWSDPGLYDLTINLASMSLKGAADIVCHAVDRPDFEATPESLQQVQDMSLECEVRAALSSDDRLWDLPLQVSAGDGSVRVSGTVKNNEIRAAIEELVGHVKGVQKSLVELSLLTDPVPGGGAAARD
ncbi:MAG: cytidylate kinase family protein [Pseudomonadota bacterium]